MDDDAEVFAERAHLMNLAYRMLGTVAEAEDAVQEAYARWYRMPREERDAIEVPRAWLTRVAGRVCLDILDSARVRREAYVGPWLPEPLPAPSTSSGIGSWSSGIGSWSAGIGSWSSGVGSWSSGVEYGDPLDRVTLDDSISTALLVVLESMTPAERVAFVLHDVFAVPFDEIATIVGRTPAACRQLATSARRRAQDARSWQVSRQHHDEVVTAFSIAARTGSLERLITVLDPNVVLRSDGGGKATAARRPVVGADNVGRFLLGIIEKHPEIEIVPTQTSDGLAFVYNVAGRITGVVNVGVVGGVVHEIWIVLNPDKLGAWN